MTSTTAPKKPRVSKEEYAKLKREEQTEMLEKAVENLMTSAGWQRYLDTRSKFHKYSFNNLMLIAMQNPEATMVMGAGGKDGKSGWKSMNRRVKEDEFKTKAIKILAPVLVPEKDEAGKPMLDEKGKPRRKLIGYRTVEVYDVEQTEGEDIPAPTFDRPLGESHEEYLYRAENHAKALGYTVEYEALGKDSKKGGWVEPLNKRIVVNGSADINGQVRTLVHELCHTYGLDYTDYSRQQAEVIVESATYLICTHIGLDTTGYSVPYIATWGDDLSPKQIIKVMREFAGKIDEVVDAVTEALS